MPNPLNYCTIEAARRLHDAEIVIETDNVWWIRPNHSPILIPKIIHTEEDDILCKKLNHIHLPATSLSEVWRELPEGTKMLKVMGQTECFFIDPYAFTTLNPNPTDAAIDLLVWLRKERANGTI